MKNTGYKKVHDPRLKRYVPKDWEHVEKHPLTASVIETINPVPVVCGVNWYSAFDRPSKEKDGRFWVGKNSDKLGYVRGGHCICMPSNGKLDTWNNYLFYNQGNEGACFLPGTLITMSDGSTKKIEDVMLLDMVVTAEGNSETVMQKMVRFHTGGLVKLSLYGHNHLRATPEHPILTKRGYVPIKEIKLDDYVCLTKPILDKEEQLLELDKIVNENESRGRYGEMSMGGVKVKINSLPKTLLLNYNLGNLLGLYAAEGGTTSNRIQLTFAGKERDTLVQKTFNLIKSELGIDAHIQKRPSGVFNVVIYGKLWRLLFERLVTGNCWDKKLSAQIMSSNSEFKKGVLDGWLEGDGHSRRKQKEGITVSRFLALDMFNIANSLNLFPAINVSTPSENKHAKRRSLRWQVTVRDEPTDHFSVIKENKCMWRRVRAIEYEDFVGYVYNMEVSNDNSYLAEGVGVHNCVGFGSSRAMTLLNKKNYNPWWLWDEAKISDDFPDTNPGDTKGTTVRAAMDVLRFKGHVPWNNNQAAMSVRDRDNLVPSKTDGIATNKWALSIDDVLSVLQNSLYEKLEAIPFINSWGTSYPWFTWVPIKIWERLLKENGEMTMITSL